MPHGTYIQRQNTTRTLLMLGLKPRQPMKGYQYKIRDVSRLSLGRKINDQNQQIRSYRVIILSITR